MAFRIHSHDAQKVVLKREPYGCANLIPLFIGIGILIVPAYFLFYHFFSLIIFEGEVLVFELRSWEEISEFDFFIGPVGILFFVIIFFATLFILVGGVIMPSVHRRTPSRIVFDHRRAGMVVKMKGAKDEGFIPYQDIESFEIHRRYSPPRGSSNRGTYVYHVVAKKKDGGLWPLTEATSGKKAVNDVELLRREVPLNKWAEEQPSARVSPKISIVEHAGVSVISWGNPFSVYFVFVFLFTLMFGTGSVLGFMEMPGLGVLFLAATALMIYLTWWMVKRHTRRLAMSIDHEKLEYYEFSRITDIRSKLVSLPLENIDRVVYELSLVNRVATDICVLTKQDVERADAAREKASGADPEARGEMELKSVLDFFRDKDQPLRLNLTALNPVECLQLENWLQDKIRNRNEDVM